MIRLIPFIYSSTIAYQVETGDEYMSFFYDGDLLDSDGASISTDYSEDDIFNLHYRQIADTMWLTHQDYPVSKLTRTTATTFSLDEVDFPRGPFLTRNDYANDDDVTMTYTGDLTPDSTGTLVCSTDYFESGHVGALFQLVQPQVTISVNQSGAGTSDSIRTRGNWTFTTSGAWAGTVDIERSSDGGTTWDVFRTFTGLTVGARNIQLSKVEDEYDILYRIVAHAGMTDVFGSEFAVSDTYQKGIVKITAVTNATTASCEVVQDVAVSAEATKKWAEGAWSDVQGYPTSICFIGNRCVYGSDRYLWLSEVGDYENFDEGVNDSDAFTISLTSTNSITWLDTIDDSMVVGTTGAPWVIQSNKVGTPITPTNYTAKEQSGFGSSTIQSVKVNNALLYVDSVQKKVYEFAYNPEMGQYSTPDMTVLAEHLTNTSTIKGMAFQKNPEPVLWVWLTDGSLLTFSYDRSQDVLAWAEQVIDGTVTSVSIMPSTNEDEVWLTVTRTVNESSISCIERFAQRTLPTSLEDAFFVDCGVIYDGESTTTIPVAHLIGETVAILADGVVLDNQVVDEDGNITLDTAASVVQVGLPYTHYLSPMRLDDNRSGSSTHGTIKNIPELVISLLDSNGVKYGDSLTNQKDVSTTDTGLVNKSEITGLFTGDVTVHNDGGFSIDDSIIISGSDPLPCTIRAIIARTDTTGR